MYCPECSTSAVRPCVERVTRVVGPSRFTAALPAMSCEECFETFVDRPAAARFETWILERLAIEGPPSAEGLVYLRRALGLKVYELCNLLQINPNTLYSWEHGKLPVNAHAWLLVGALVLEQVVPVRPLPSTRERMESLLKVPPIERVMPSGAGSYRQE